MASDEYAPTTALTAYYPSRSGSAIARLWAVDKWLRDAAAVGLVSVFAGPGPDPTILYGYGPRKIWLRQDVGVADESADVRYWTGAGDESDETAWAALTPDAFLQTVLGVGANYVAASATAQTIGAGSKAFVVPAGKPYFEGMRLRAASASASANWVEGRVTSYTGTTLTIQVDLYGGSGSVSDWVVGLAGQPGRAVLNDEGPPADSDGANGDLYFDLTHKRIYGPKADDAWPLTYLEFDTAVYADAAAAAQAAAETAQGAAEAAQTAAEAAQTAAEAAQTGAETAETNAAASAAAADAAQASGYAGTSATSLAVPTAGAAVSLTTQSGKKWAAGMALIVASGGSTAAFEMSVTSYSGTTLQGVVTGTPVGSGTHADWYVGATLNVSAESLLNSRRARRWISGNAITVAQGSGAEGITVRTERGYYYIENNGGVYKYKIAAAPAQLMSAGWGYVVDLDGTPDGSGELVPEYVSIASGAETGWEAGQRIILVARNNDGALFGGYSRNAHVGAFDGEVVFTLNPGDELPSWDGTTRTLTWPDLIIMRHRGNNLGSSRIKLLSGSIVVPSGRYQTVVLDLSAIVEGGTPNTAVSAGQYTDAPPGWNGAQGDTIPLFAVGDGFAYPVRFPPTRGATNFPSIISDQSPYSVAEIVVQANGTDKVDVFMKGSNPVSNTYLKYPFTNTPNSGIGSDVWRWDETYEVERTGDATFVQGLMICNSGECETAIRIIDNDFMGGVEHGNELKQSARMLVDGVEKPLDSTGNYRGRRVEFFQESFLYEPGTVTPQSNHVATAYKHWAFEAGEVFLEQYIVWHAVVTLTDTYLTMLPILRVSGAIAVTTQGFRPPYWGEENISSTPFTTVHTKANRIKVGGPSGYSAEVEILRGWDKPDRDVYISNSPTFNKLYFDFTDLYTTSIGEAFDIAARYRISTIN